MAGCFWPEAGVACPAQSAEHLEQQPTPLQWMTALQRLRSGASGHLIHGFGSNAVIQPAYLGGARTSNGSKAAVGTAACIRK